MLTLNKYQHTIDGEKLMPITISGDTVQCVDMRGIVVMKNINDFPNKPEEEEQQEKIIEVAPIEEKNTDVLLDKKEINMVEYEGELFEQEEVKKEEEKPKPISQKTKKPKTRYISDEEYI